MEQELIKIITGQGPWAVLFIWMLLYWKKDKENTQAKDMAREEKSYIQHEAREKRITEEAKEREERILVESKAREERLMLLVEKNTDLLDKTTDKFDMLTGSINDLSKEFTGFRERWDKVEGKGRS